MRIKGILLTYKYEQFQATSSALYASARGTFNDTNPLANVTVLGVSDPVSNATLNGIGVPASGVNYNGSSKALMVTGLRDLTAGGAWKEDWVLEWS